MRRSPKAGSTQTGSISSTVVQGSALNLHIYMVHTNLKWISWALSSSVFSAICVPPSKPPIYINARILICSFCSIYKSCLTLLVQGGKFIYMPTRKTKLLIERWETSRNLGDISTNSSPEVSVSNNIVAMFPIHFSHQLSSEASISTPFPISTFQSGKHIPMIQ